MNDGTTTERGSGSGGTDDHVRTEEALDEILGNETQFRYLVLALVAAGLWWWALDPISAFTAGMGFVVLGFVVGPVVGMFATKRWTTTDGVVLESAVLTRRQARERTDVGTPGNRSLSEYVSLVRYEYVVDGTTYENARISPLDASTSRRRWAESLVDSYPEGRQVGVRYHPDDPVRSYLQSWTLASRINVMIPIALFFLTLAVIVAAGMNTDSGVPAGLVPIVMGLPFTLWGLYGVQQAVLSYRWPTTTGVVTGTNVKAVAGGDEGTTRYSVEVHYEYEIDGDTYASKRYSFGGRPVKSTRSAARGWLEDHYPVGSEVTVHYRPDGPDETVLETGGAWSAFVVFLAGLVFCALGIYILLQPGLAILPTVEAWIDRIVEQVS